MMLSNLYIVKFGDFVIRTYYIYTHAQGCANSTFFRFNSTQLNSSKPQLNSTQTQLNYSHSTFTSTPPPVNQLACSFVCSLSSLSSLSQHLLNSWMQQKSLSLHSCRSVRYSTPCIPARERDADGSIDSALVFQAAIWVPVG